MAKNKSGSNGTIKMPTTMPKIVSKGLPKNVDPRVQDALDLFTRLGQSGNIVIGGKKK